LKREFTNNQMAYDHVDIFFSEFEHSFIIPLLFTDDGHIIPVTVSTGNSDAAVHVFHRVGHCKIETFVFKHFSQFSENCIRHNMQATMSYSLCVELSEYVIFCSLFLIKSLTYVTIYLTKQFLFLLLICQKVLLSFTCFFFKLLG